MSQQALKLFRDPLYDYCSLQPSRDAFVLELLDSREVQRLRRVHQLGVTEYTYPGASHTRFSHTLGVLHLMQQALDRLETQEAVRPEAIEARRTLLAAAVLHDTGHGPFSHLFEPCLGTKHEHWSIEVIKNEESEAHRILKNHGVDHLKVAALIEEKNLEARPWQKFLLSSQLDVDRMDYLRRDSFFTGSGAGGFDWFRLIHTMEIVGEPNALDIVWPEKAKYGIEEYIFARFYMYQNVYLHKTTRGFEKIIKRLWELGGQPEDAAAKRLDVAEIRRFRRLKKPSLLDYLALEESVMIYQIHRWRKHPNPEMADLASRLLDRRRLCAVEAPARATSLNPEDADGPDAFEKELREVVRGACPRGVPPHCLSDEPDPKYDRPYKPYQPEKDAKEQSAPNAIRLLVDGEAVEVSEVLPRLKGFTGPGKVLKRRRFYVPEEAVEEARRFAADRA